MERKEKLTKVRARLGQTYFDKEFGIMECWHLSDCKRINLEARKVNAYGLADVLLDFGYELINDDIPVYQGKHKIGTVPADFEPSRIRSTNFLYEPRPGDFIRKDDHWEANRMLGHGDFEAIPQFKFDPEYLEKCRG